MRSHNLYAGPSCHGKWRNHTIGTFVQQMKRPLFGHSILISPIIFSTILCMSRTSGYFSVPPSHKRTLCSQARLRSYMYVSGHWMLNGVNWLRNESIVKTTINSNANDKFLPSNGGVCETKANCARLVRGGGGGGAHRLKVRHHIERPPQKPRLHCSICESARVAWAK